MPVEAPVVRVFFGTEQSPTLFTLNHSTKGLLDSSTYVLGGDVGTDISDHVYAVSVNRGRTRELDEFNAGTCNVELRNYDRLFDPLNPGVPGHIDFPGASGNYLSGASSGSTLTGMQIVANVALDDWTPSSSQYVVARWQTASTLRYRFGVNSSGGLTFGGSSDGTTEVAVNSTVAAGGVNGEFLWIAVTIEELSGDDIRVRFWVSDDGSAWDQLGNAVDAVGGEPGSFVSLLEFGSVLNGTSGLLAGRLADVGIDQNKGVDFNGDFDPDITWYFRSADYPDNTHSTIDGQGGTFTLNRSGGTQAAFVEATAPLYGALVPGKQMEVSVFGQSVFAGNVEEWNASWDVTGEASASFTGEDSLAALSRTTLDAFTATSSQAPGARLSAVLDRGEINFGSNREFDTGQSTLQGDSVAAGTNTLSYCQSVARSDGGRLFVDRDGVITFMDRHHEIFDTVAATFRDDDTAIPFIGVGVDTGSSLLFTRVAAERDGGTVQMADDTMAQSAYGVRTLSLSGLLQNSDAQVEDMAEYLLNVYKDPQTRISSLVVNVAALAEGDAVTVVGLDIGRLIRVVWTPTGGAEAIDQTLVIEGVSHQMSTTAHIVTFSTSPVTQFGQVFILDSTSYGRLDTDPLAF